MSVELRPCSCGCSDVRTELRWDYNTIIGKAYCRGCHVQLYKRAETHISWEDREDPEKRKAYMKDCREQVVATWNGRERTCHMKPLFNIRFSDPSTGFWGAGATVRVRECSACGKQSEWVWSLMLYCLQCGARIEEE